MDRRFTRCKNKENITLINKSYTNIMFGIKTNLRYLCNKIVDSKNTRLHRVLADKELTSTNKQRGYH